MRIRGVLVSSEHRRAFRECLIANEIAMDLHREQGNLLTVIDFLFDENDRLRAERAEVSGYAQEACAALARVYDEAAKGLGKVEESDEVVEAEVIEPCSCGGLCSPRV